MKRILLFVLTNFAILAVASVTLRLLGVEPWLNQNGINFTSLLIFGAVLGFGGAFVSLAISKWTAKRAMGVQVIESPRNADEASACQRSAASSRRHPTHLRPVHAATARSSR
jgi:heat shock protein HtpX